MDGHASAVVVIDLSCRIDSCTETPNDPVDELFLGSLHPGKNSPTENLSSCELGFRQERFIEPDC